MKQLLIFSVFLLGFIQVKSQGELGGNNLSNAFFIKTSEGGATSFLGKYRGKIYLISAKHAFSKSGLQELEIFNKGGFVKFQGNVYFHKNKNIDLAVVVSSVTEHSNYGIELDPDSAENMYIGDTGYFLGFPYGFKTIADELNNGFPFPLVKKATFSGMIEENGVQYLLLDGFNNPGFSGGPVLHRNYVKLDPNERNKMSLFAVIKAYYPQSDTLIISKRKLPYQENSGIVVAMPMRYIVEIIKQIK